MSWDFHVYYICEWKMKKKKLRLMIIFLKYIGNYEVRNCNRFVLPNFFSLRISLKIISLWTEMRINEIILFVNSNVRHSAVFISGRYSQGSNRNKSNCRLSLKEGAWANRSKKTERDQSIEKTRFIVTLFFLFLSLAFGFFYLSIYLFIHAYEHTYIYTSFMDV